MRIIKEKDLIDFETDHTENLRSAVRWVISFYLLIVLLYTSSNYSEEPECFNFLLDTLSSDLLICLEIHKHFTRNISVGRR